MAAACGGVGAGPKRSIMAVPTGVMQLDMLVTRAPAASSCWRDPAVVNTVLWQTGFGNLTLRCRTTGGPLSAAASRMPAARRTARSCCGSSRPPQRGSRQPKPPRSPRICSRHALGQAHVCIRSCDCHERPAFCSPGAIYRVSMSCCMHGRPSSASSCRLPPSRRTWRRSHG